MLKLISLVALLTGCLTSTTDADPTDDGMGIEAVAPRAKQPADQRDNNPCAKLPADDTACAVACDPDALTSFIPPGSCVLFACTLTDGTLYRTGGCRPDEAQRPIEMGRFGEAERETAVEQ